MAAKVEFDGEMSKLRGTLGDMKGEIGSWGSQVSSVLAGTFGASALTSALSGIKTGLRAAVGEVTNWIAASREAAQVDAQLEAIVKSTGGSAGFTADELKKMATELQGVSNFGDEAIKTTQTMLLGFKSIKGEEFKQASALAVDMGARFGDAAAGATFLGRALNDPVRGIQILKKEGVGLTEEQAKLVKAFVDVGDKAAAQRIIMGQLEQVYGGAAEAAVEADGGFKQLAEQIGDIQEEFGGKLIEAIGNVGPALKFLVGEAGKYLGQMLDDVIAIGKGFAESFGGAETSSEKLVVVTAQVAHGVKVAALATEDYLLRIARLAEIAAHPIATVTDSKQTQLEKRLGNVQEQRANLGTAGEAGGAALESFRAAQKEIEEQKKAAQEKKQLQREADAEAGKAAVERATAFTKETQAFRDAFPKLKADAKGLNEVFGKLPDFAKDAAKTLGDRFVNPDKIGADIKQVFTEAGRAGGELSNAAQAALQKGVGLFATEAPKEQETAKASFEDASSLFRRIQSSAASASPAERVARDQLAEQKETKSLTSKMESHLETIASKVVSQGPSSPTNGAAVLGP